MANARRLPRQKYDARVQLMQLGFSEPDARTMLRAANQLHRWHELECGIDAPQGALQAIARDDDTGKLTWYDGCKWRPYYGRDNEKLALAAIQRVMVKHPNLDFYIQGDPRGCSLYVLRPGDVPEGEQVETRTTLAALRSIRSSGDGKRLLLGSSSWQR